MQPLNYYSTIADTETSRPPCRSALLTTVVPFLFGASIALFFFPSNSDSAAQLFGGPAVLSRRVLPPAMPAAVAPTLGRRPLPPMSTTAAMTEYVVPEEPDWGTLGGFALKQAKKAWRVEIAPTLPIPGVVSPWRELVGRPLTRPSGEVVPWADVFDGPDAPPVVGLYFGARHCRPCKAFIGKFVKAYTEMNAKGRKIEILFASMDFDEEQRNAYLSEKPYFLGLPYEMGGMLKSGWKVSGTPAVFVMDPRTGHLLSQNAKQDLEDMGPKAINIWLQRLKQVPPS
eukprot:EG_transcript_21521